MLNVIGGVGAAFRSAARGARLLIICWEASQAGNGHAIPCEKKGIFAGATVELEEYDRHYGRFESAYSTRLRAGASDHGIREDFVVVAGHLIEYESGRRCGDGERRHASTSIMVGVQSLA